MLEIKVGQKGIITAKSIDIPFEKEYTIFTLDLSDQQVVKKRSGHFTLRKINHLIFGSFEYRIFCCKRRFLKLLIFLIKNKIIIF